MKRLVIPLLLFALLLPLSACEEDPFAPLRGNVNAQGGFTYNGAALEGTLSLTRSPSLRLTVTLTAPASLRGMVAERTEKGDSLTYLGIRREMAAPLEALDLLLLLLTPPDHFERTQTGIQYKVSDGSVTLLSESALFRLRYEGERGRAELWWQES